MSDKKRYSESYKRLYSRLSQDQMDRLNAIKGMGEGDKINMMKQMLPEKEWNPGEVI